MPAPEPEPEPTQPLWNESPSPDFASTQPDRHDRTRDRLASRFPLELRLLQKAVSTPQEITAIYNRLAAMPFMLDDTLRDPFIFGQSICTTVTYLVGDPPVGIIWFPYLTPGTSSAVAGALWHHSGLCRWREIKIALAVVASAHKIHRFWTLTAVKNKRAQKLAERLGFQEEGVLRDGLCYNGQWENVTVSGLLREEIR